MAQPGRPKSLTEKMTTIRVRESQAQLLSALRQSKGEPHHQVLLRVLKAYLDKRPVLRAAIKRRLHEKERD